MPGIDVQQGKGNRRGSKSPLRQMHKRNGVLPTRKKQGRPLELGRGLPNHINRLALQFSQRGRDRPGSGLIGHRIIVGNRCMPNDSNQRK